MSDQLNDQTTQSLLEEMTARFDRLESLIGSLGAEMSAIKSGVDQIERTQREMYVDLRERIKLVQDGVNIVQRRLEQFIQDQQPDSLPSRLTR